MDNLHEEMMNDPFFKKLKENTDRNNNFLNEEVPKKCGLENRVSYDVRDEDADHQHDLNEVPIKGKVKVIQDHEEVFLNWQSEDDPQGDGEYYEGDILTNPTWLNLVVEANKQIYTNKDFNHIYFSGYTIKEEKDDITYIKLELGS